MRMGLDALNLLPRGLGDVSAYLLEIPCPPQLRRAIGYKGSAEYLGIWWDNGKITVSDGHSTFTSSNPGWEAYCNYYLIGNYIYTLRASGAAEVNFFGRPERHNVAEHGFLLAEGNIYLATVKNITRIVGQNSDSRPDWIQNATVQDMLDEKWQNKYHSYSGSQIFPRHDLDSLQATKQMLYWLDNNF